MADNIVNTRIQLKNDTEANWQLATNFKPRKGEIIISNVDSTHSFPLLRVGDGITPAKDLPILNLQPDWNTNDTSSGYIKNKPIIIKSTQEWQDDNTIYPIGTIMLYSDYKIVTIGSQSYTIVGIKIADGNNVSSIQPFTDTDTLQNITLATTTKAYLTGITTTPTATPTAMAAIADTGIYTTTTAGELSAVRHSWNVEGVEKAHTIYNATDDTIDFIFD